MTVYNFDLARAQVADFGSQGGGGCLGGCRWSRRTARWPRLQAVEHFLQEFAPYGVQSPGADAQDPARLLNCLPTAEGLQQRAQPRLGLGRAVEVFHPGGHAGRTSTDHARPLSCLILDRSEASAHR